jgi:Tfp pilus assembly protein PilV
MLRARQLRQEEGFALLEAIVSAALLAVMVVAVFTTFDVANKVSGEEKARAVAASIAQREVEYMRSLPVSKLASIADLGTQPPTTETIDNVGYTITRSATWLPRGSDTASCTAGAAVDYLKVIATVTPPANAGINAVSLTSVIAPTAGSFDAGEGSLAVTVQNAAVPPTGQPNVNVTLKGTGTSTSRTTDSSGCAFFAQQPTGDYSVVLSAPGMVDTKGDAAPAYPVKISPEVVTPVTYQYATAGSRTVKFTTQKIDATGTILATPLVDAKARNIMVAPSGTLSPRRFGDGSLQTSIAATSLFPFSSAYAVYAGDCTGARPADAVAAAPRPAVPTSANATDSADVVVLMPVVNVTVKNSTGTSNVSGASIFLTAKTGDCTGTVQLGGPGATTASNGRLVADGTGAMPFGTYDICVVDASNKKYTGTVASASGIDNTGPGGVSKTVKLTSTGSSCP